MNIILIAGHADTLEKALEFDEGLCRLDMQIKILEAMKYEIIVVTSGFGSEQLLRKSVYLERCELVFDTHDAEATLITNIRAGLAASPEACFVLPASKELPEQKIFQDLINAYYQAGLRTETHGFWEGDFPVLVTRTGNEFIRSHLELKTIEELTLVQVEDGKLATRVKSL